MSDDRSQFSESLTRPAQSWRRDFVAEWHRFANGFTRENIISNLKTLAWTIPLTLLIWVYAEREQVQPMSDVVVPFELTTVDSDRVISLSASQDRNLVLDVIGPQARLQELKNRLSGGQMPQGLKLEVPTYYEVNRQHSLPTLPLVRAQRIFADYGVTVRNAQPALLNVTIDQLVDRDARVSVRPGLNNVDATFEPTTVKVHGPKTLLDSATSSGAGGRSDLVVHADIPESTLSAPGHHDLPDVLLVRPGVLTDPRVSIMKTGKIRASIDVRKSDKTEFYSSMPVTVDQPVDTAEKYIIQIDRPAVQNVTVIGPPELIDNIKRSEFRPKARLVITAADLARIGERQSKVVQYDLPNGVQVSDEDKSKMVEFRVVDRAAAGTP